MRNALYILILIIILSLFVSPVMAESFTAPDVPQNAAQWMPSSTDDFGSGLWEMLQKTTKLLRPALMEAVKTGVAVFACVMLVSVLGCAGEGISSAELAGAVCISYSVIRSSKAMISLASETVASICEYSKLLLPVITAASAAQGGVTSATALHIGTAAFTSFLYSIISHILIPAVYFFLAAAIASCVLGEEMMKQMKEHLKKFSAWFLKSILAIYMSYISVTGIVTGTVDKAAQKTAKAAISTVVPVIGKSLAEASDALLISIGIAKNAVGIYGIFALLAIVLAPFLKIGANYLVLKGIAMLCSFPDSKRLSTLVADFSSAMGLLLGIVGSICVMSLIGAVSFMRGMI